jgi:integrase
MMQFTDRYIQNLKPTDKKFYVREARGFTLQVLPSGVKTFIYLYTWKGKRKHYNLGIYPHVKLADAREKYQEAYNKVKNGIDLSHKPDEEPIDENLTFKHFSDLFLTWSEQHHVPALYKINKHSLDNDVLPFWKDTPLLQIRRRDAITLLERVALRSKGQVSNVQRAARGVFQYAIDREHIDYNPLLKLNKVLPDLRHVPRERVLSDSEIKQIWSSLPAYLKLILVTAQRPGEVAGIHTSEIQIGVKKPLCLTCRGCGWWTIPPERTKNRKEHMVYLTTTALKLIGEIDGYIFPSPKPDKPIGRMALSRYVNRLKYFDLPRWTPHDLRRTARTHMAKIGIIDEHAEAILAHCKQGIKKVYNKYEYHEEKKAALLKWEKALLNILGC